MSGWKALTDATPENSYLYVILWRYDPGYERGSGRSRSVSLGPFFGGEGYPVAVVVSDGVVVEDLFGEGDECCGYRIGGGGGGGGVGD